MLSQLYKFQRVLGIKGGRYLFYPNRQVPFLLLPYQNRNVFYKALEILPFTPMKIRFYKLLRKIFKSIPIIALCGEEESLDFSAEGDYYSIVIFPFSIHRKMLLILFKDSEVFVRKVAFEDSKDLLYNEYKAMTMPLISPIAPQVIQYCEYDNLSILDMEFVKGSCISGNKLPEQVVNFFNKLYSEYSQGSFYPSEHSYILNMINFVESKLKLFKNDMLLEKWMLFKDKIMNINKRFLLTAMHGDFTRSNIIMSSSVKILDWEFFSTNGINIDLSYYSFRKVLDSKFPTFKKNIHTTYPIETLYYIYFYLKNIDHSATKIIKKVLG
ncbi:hypothetical protein [Phorcysia thermohydrogeniphila]|uniref:Phosphotransferase family enzyme n=1 Tax=Phorcysia thermohydrogeniphila TaxID=936138 RepID=A0A4R1GCG0_9BACT|nr:hypothetical protein [Phorcysia thermohydrogeniphila]TCK04453.1 hypothetical protein CLV27_0878 [Phorcysia thermohydrogeniphila]